MVSSSSTATPSSTGTGGTSPPPQQDRQQQRGRGSGRRRMADSALVQGLLAVVLLNALYRIGQEAYRIRLYAIAEFGRVIHEFDPYFNYRATEYLYEHGWYAFRTWFDYKVWYPLGRPVGTTIYPGMQVTAVLIKRYVAPTMSINDICVFIPAWFGVSATLAVAWLSYECTRSSSDNFTSILNQIPLIKQFYNFVVKPLVALVLKGMKATIGTDLGLSPSSTAKTTTTSRWITPALCAVGAAAIMSIVPAHLLRSVGGGYDNESIAMTAMVLTFACWCFSLRDNVSLTQTTLAGALTGLAYFNMVAAWGGYVFVLNVIGVHAGFLVLLGRYSTKLHRAYSAFYIIGTTLATRVPVVGWTPLKSIEQLGAFVAFGGLQLIELCEIQRKRKSLSKGQAWKLRVMVFGAAWVGTIVIVQMLMPTGYFGPISSRVRGLFVEHTKTGNPLVDSVAEHQAASPQAYFQYLDDVCYLAPVAFAATALFFFNDSSSFLIVYGMAAYFFSHKMVRLILLTAPIASVLGGIFLGRFTAWMLHGAFDLVDYFTTSEIAVVKEETESEATKMDDSKNSDKSNKKKSSKKTKQSEKNSETVEAVKSHPLVPIILLARLLFSGYVMFRSIPYFFSFYSQSHAIAKQISHPTIINKAQLQNGDVVIVDDYRDAYDWLRDNTPEDARIMAWWDYGYQITGIANRTTIADGNTWNHEHIALLGRVLTASEKDAHRIARHLADYVLVWAGGGGDDVAKSPHLRRIANSVYRGLCREPTCREFGFYQDRTPTKDMKESLLYKLHSHGITPGIEADKNRFREVYSSKYGKVRIYKIQSVSQESKEWVENNKICDAPGSWFCRGQYPPALQKILKEKKDFKQLEDFNYKGEGEDDSEYQKKYFENLNRRDAPLKKKPSGSVPKLSQAQVDKINDNWENNEMTSMIYELISNDNYADLREMFMQTPELAHIRSEDGRGPMFWAHELGRKKIIKMLKTLEVSETRIDASGKTPLDLSKA